MMPIYCVPLCVYATPSHMFWVTVAVLFTPRSLLIADPAGENFAAEAVEAQEDSWQAHKWFAVLTGTGTRFVGTNEKIQRGQKYKVSMSAALRALN